MALFSNRNTTGFQWTKQSLKQLIKIYPNNKARECARIIGGGCDEYEVAKALAVLRKQGIDIPRKENITGGITNMAKEIAREINGF